jgi:hypothetical protein
MFLTKGYKELGVIRIFCPIVGHSDKPTVSIPQSRVNFILEWFFGLVSCPCIKVNHNKDIPP